MGQLTNDFINSDSWSFDDSGWGKIDNTLGANDTVNSTYKSGETAKEKLGYLSNIEHHKTLFATGVMQTVDYVRNAHYQTQIVTIANFDSNAPNATNPAPTVAGDSHVIVTGNRHEVYYKLVGAIPTSKLDEIIQDLASGQTTVITMINVMDEDGNFGNISSTTTPPNWDPRTRFEHGIDGSPLPQTSSPIIDPSYDAQPPGIFEPVRVKHDQTWLDWFGGHRGDAGDQAIFFVAGVADSMTMNISYLTRNAVGGDGIDYDSGGYVWGTRTGTAISLATGGPAMVKGVASGAKALKAAANSFDEAGQCANLLTKVIHGGCFVSGTLVTLSEMPYSESNTNALWSDSTWLDDIRNNISWTSHTDSDSTTKLSSSSLLSQSSSLLQVPIENVPIGARVPTKNPKPWEFDDSLPEPDKETWALIKLTVERNDGGIVDAEIIRPREWIERNGIKAGRLLPLNLPELEVSGFAQVTVIEYCPRIATGEGSVVTARFLTREVHSIARVIVARLSETSLHDSSNVGFNCDEMETIEGTLIHPIWSEDRQDWVPLGKLIEGERLRGTGGIVEVRSIEIASVAQPVYNIEVHGEHVYEASDFGLLVHDAYSSTSGNNIAAALGQRMHKLYKAGLDDQISTFKEYVIKGTRKKIDFLDVKNGIVYELKPNNPKAIARGWSQAQGYVNDLQSLFPGSNWRIVVDTY